MLKMRSVGRRPDPYIPTASMADIVFLLIIFFIITYHIEVDKVAVRLPETTVREDIPREAAYVSIDLNDMIRVSAGKETSVPVSSAEEVQSFAANVVTREPTQSFVIKADAGTRYRMVDSVIDALKQAKVETIYLLSEQKTVEPGRGSR
jgi:biopolymer transport protein ExbD